jgi:hypothetical protein
MTDTERHERQMSIEKLIKDLKERERRWMKLIVEVDKLASKGIIEAGVCGANNYQLGILKEIKTLIGE